ncbi:MAG: ZIP family metal transporter [Candidatus Altiarchaeota archaeon]|nr:ZIP family metal transporter [Candidatus Altiarchaeota archaeon]
MFSETFIWISVFAVLAAVVNGLGIVAIYRRREWAEKTKTYFMCFAAGMLISTSLILALPNALKTNPHAGFIALLGFLFMFFSNELIKHHTQQKELGFGITAAEGIGLHSFIDGVIYAVTFKVSVLTGILSATGLVIHEFAEGVITYIFLIEGGLDKKIAGICAFLIAGLTTPLGAFIVYPLVNSLGGSTLGLMLGFVAGVLLYLSASHLLPKAREQKKEHSSLAFLAGVGLALFIVLTKIV